MRRLFRLALPLLLAACAPPDDAVRIVGSSTVFPFSRVVAERTAIKFDAPAPIVEMTGTGGGLQQFCHQDSGVDIANASRAIKPAEVELCRENGVADVIEFKIGFDGVVAAVAPGNPLRALTKEQIWRGVAKDVPGPDGIFVPNPNKLWSDVDPSLPPVPIEVHGPPPTSGTRDAFAELTLEAGAKKIPALAALAEADPDTFKARARGLREDGAWVDEGENDNAIIQMIRTSKSSVGVFGYSFYDQNQTVVRGLSIDDVAPSIEAIKSGAYPLARSLYFYVNGARLDADVAHYVLEFMSESAAGEFGYLREKGLVPLGPEARRAEIEKARALAARAAPKAAS